MIEYGMRIEDVKNALFEPDKILQGRENKNIVEKKIGNRRIRVIYTLEENKIIVITTYLVF